MPSIRAITTYQPWASLIVIGAKRFETRSWRTSYRGIVAIHAGLNLSYRHLALDEPFRSAFENAELNPDDLPLGAIVGWATLVDCFPVASVLDRLDERESAFGDFSPGRFAWLMVNPWRLPSAIPTSGRQGLWTWDAPDSWSHEGYPVPARDDDVNYLRLR